MTIDGILSAARTLVFYSRLQEIKANNLANVSTNGFKADLISAYLDPDTNTPVPVRAIDLQQGSIRETQNALDLALNGPGFFVVQTPQGDRLTRNGSFSLDRNSTLVDIAGRPVVGENGPVVVQGAEVVVHADGAVEVDGEVVDRLRLVDVEDPTLLEKEGVSLFVSPTPIVPVSDRTTLLQYSVEESNMDPIQGISSMIEVQKNFAFNMNALSTMDDVMETTVNNVGRV